MRGINVKNAGSEDIPHLKAVEIECGLSPWTLEGYQSEFDRKDSVALVAQAEDKEIVGFVIGRIPVGSDGVAEIYNIGTIPTYQRRGIGKALLTDFLDLCIERGVREVWLEVRASNHEALSFYRSNGFKSSGIRPNFYENPRENADLMFLRLDSQPVLTKP